MQDLNRSTCRMCIAIANTKGNPLTDEQLTACWENNPDGAGIMYKEGGMLKVYKQQGSLPRFKKKYYQVVELSNCLVHFRVKSAGVISMSNIHPFMVNGGLGFIHNGTIFKMPKDDNLSDTQIFNQAILKNLPKDFINNQAVLELIEDYCGNSKLVFMDEDEQFTIINEDRGKWSNGNWYSNDSYKRVNSFYYRGSEKVTKTTGTGCHIPKAPKLPAAYKPPVTTQPEWSYEDYYGELDDARDTITFSPDELDDIEPLNLESDSWSTKYNMWIEEVCDIIDQVDYELIENLDYDAIAVSQVMVEGNDKDDIIHLFMKDCERALDAVNTKHDKRATLQGCVALYEAQEAI